MGTITSAVVQHTLIIGGGIAGLTLAIELAEDPHQHITLLIKSDSYDQSNSWMAQGGIVSRGINDSAELLETDIRNASDGLASAEAAHILATQGPDCVQKILIQKAGIPFDEGYGLEAAHCVPRILHVHDATGKAIIQHLWSVAKTLTNIHILLHHTAVDCIVHDGVCVGVTAYDSHALVLKSVYAHSVVLATGGCGQVYSITSNPTGATGDGLAMAIRAGAQVQDLEYMQFHPTVFALEPFLISEAVRGAGGILNNNNNEAFMSRYNAQWKDLAPRDEVSRAIFYEMQHTNSEYVFLNIANAMSADAIKKRFPTIYEKCLSHGIDITKDPIPVVPGAHYHCGGVAVDANGCTSIQNLYAIGEVSCTGLHGANRLASTSLLEGLVWGARLARYIFDHSNSTPLLYSDDFVALTPEPMEEGQYNELLTQIQKIMHQKVGVIRTTQSLTDAVDMLGSIKTTAELWFASLPISLQSVTLRNLASVAYAIALSAYANPQSAGCHYREG